MRTLRLVTAAVVLAALSTIGAAAAHAGDAQRGPSYSVQSDNWHW